MRDQHPYYETYRQRDFRLYQDQLDNEKQPRREGVRVLDDGTVQRYVTE